MASGHICKVHSLLTRFSLAVRLRQAQPSWVPIQHKSGVPSLDSPDCNVEIGVTSDGKTIVCHHPTTDIPYELTQPIERPNPLTSQPETHDQVLKAHLSKELQSGKPGPTIEELSKMFYTTKHRWYPVGQYHMRRRKREPPQDR